MQIYNFQALVNLLPIVMNNGLTGVGVSPKIIHAQGNPKLQGKLEMFYGLEKGCFKMLVPGGTLCLQQDGAFPLEKYIASKRALPIDGTMI